MHLDGQLRDICSKRETRPPIAAAAHRRSRRAPVRAAGASRGAGEAAGPNGQRLCQLCLLPGARGCGGCGRLLLCAGCAHDPAECAALRAHPGADARTLCAVRLAD
eukprot:gene4333-24344_t